MMETFDTNDLTYIDGPEHVGLWDRYREYKFKCVTWGFKFQRIEVRFEVVQFSEDRSPTFAIPFPVDPAILHEIDRLGFPDVGKTIRSMTERRGYYD